VTPSSDATEYRRFGGHCCLHPHPEDVTYRITTRRHNTGEHDFILSTVKT